MFCENYSTYQHQLVYRVDPSNQFCFGSLIPGLVLGEPIVRLVLEWHKHLFLPNQLEPRIYIREKFQDYI